MDKRQAETAKDKTRARELGGMSPIQTARLLFYGDIQIGVYSFNRGFTSFIQQMFVKGSARLKALREY